MIRRLFRTTRRWLRGLFFGVSARVAATRSFRSPGILDVGTDGTIRITPITGPALVGPRVVVNASFTNARTQRLARRAAAFLFDHYGFAAVPAQFWPIFERSFDPGKAMNAFLRAVGCDPERVRRKDSGELLKVSEVIELLILSGDILHRLSPEVRRIVGLQLESGDYTKIRNLAEVASNLQAAVDFASPWSGKAVVASFTTTNCGSALVGVDPPDADIDASAASIADPARCRLGAVLGGDKISSRERLDIQLSR